MPCCSNPRPLVYRTVRGSRWTVRYRRCYHCGATSKTIQAGYIDARSWLEREVSLLDGPSIQGDSAIMSSMELFNPCEESYVDDKQFD